MAVDWVTVSAQIVNFLILVGLLKHFLYQPVMSAMSRREQHIADRLKEAQERERQAMEKAEELDRKVDEMERHREDILAKAREDAREQKKQLLDEARTEVEHTRDGWHRQVQLEKDEFLGNLRQESTAAAMALMRKALVELADADLEERIVHTFVERMKSVDAKTKQGLLDGSKHVRVTTAFDLEPVVRGKLTRMVHEHLRDDVEVDYVQSPDLLCGIELSGGERRLSWNLNAYLDEVSSRVQASLNRVNPERGAR